MKRLFCAVKVPARPKIVNIFDVYKHELAADSIKWADPGNMHITLKFLGDTPLQLLGPIIECLHEVATDFPPFSIRIQGCGTFGKFKLPRVIWLGVKNAEPLIALANQVQQALSSAGFEPDKKLFSPHLTIGRIKQLNDRGVLDKLQRRHSNELLAELEVGSFMLIESFLRPQGPMYTTIQRFELGEGHRA